MNPDALKVWAVLTGPTSNRKVRWLYRSEYSALRKAEEYSRQHDRQTPADVTCMTVED